MKPYDRLREKVLERDCWSCLDCGCFTAEIHHILSRRYGKVAWEERNMLSLCHECHLYKDGGAHRTIKRKEHLELLAKLHGYEYDEPRFQEVLNA